MESIIARENKTEGLKYVDEPVVVGNPDGEKSETRTTDLKSEIAESVVDAIQPLPTGVVVAPSASKSEVDLPAPARAAPVMDPAAV